MLTASVVAMATASVAATYGRVLTASVVATYGRVLTHEKVYAIHPPGGKHWLLISGC